MMKDKRKIREIYVCSGIFHLFQSLYISGQTDNEKVLIYANNALTDIPVDIFSDFFDDIVYVRNFRNDSFLPKTFMKLLYEGRLFDVSRLARVCKDNNVRYRVYVFNDYQPITAKIIEKTEKNKESIVLVEEGLMTYSTNQYWLTVPHHELLNKLIGITVESTPRHNHAIDTIMCQFPDKLPAIKSEGRRIVKINDMFLDKEWVSRIIEVLKLEFEYDSENIALWLGQPLAIDSIVESDKEEIEFIRKISGILKDDYKLVIKMHPRDIETKYDSLSEEKNISILDLGDKFWVPVELIFQKIKPKLIFTAFSSAANFFLKINRDVKVIYCVKMMNIQLDEDCLGHLRGKNKYLPESIQDIKGIIKNRKYKNK